MLYFNTSSAVRLGSYGWLARWLSSRLWGVLLPNTPPTTKQQPEDVDDNDPLIHRHQNICGNEARWVSPFTEIPIRIVTHPSSGGAGAGGGGIQNTRWRRRWREEHNFVLWCWFIRESSIGSEPHDSQDLIDSWPTPPPPAPEFNKN